MKNGRADERPIYINLNSNQVINGPKLLEILYDEFVELPTYWCQLSLNDTNLKLVFLRQQVPVQSVADITNREIGA